MRTVALGDVCAVTMGQAPPGDSYNDQRKGVPLVAGAGDFSGSGFAVTKFTTAPTRLSAAGDIVLSVRASIGAKVLADKEYCLGRGVAGLRANRAFLESRYLWHWLSNAERKLAAKGRGATFLQVNRSDIEEMPLPLPEMGEQRRIAAILDQTDALRAKRREVLAHLDALTQSIFYEACTKGSISWHKLGEVADFYGGASLPDGVPFNGQVGGRLLMKVSDMNRGGNEECINATALWSDQPTARAVTAPAGAVVIPKRGGAIGTNKKRMTTRATALDPNLMGVAPHCDLISSRFLHEWFKSFDLSQITSGSTVPQLNKQDLAPLPIGLPPMDTQREFEAQLTRIDSQRRRTRDGDALMLQLMSSLQSRAFQGEL